MGDNDSYESRFLREIAELTGAEPDGWIFIPESDGGDAIVFFSCEGRPLLWETLEKLNDEYGVVEVQSDISGRRGSLLSVELENP